MLIMEFQVKRHYSLSASACYEDIEEMRLQKNFAAYFQLNQ